MEYVEKAVRHHVWLRAFFYGPSGAGKSLGALRTAAALGGVPEGENGRLVPKIPVTLVSSEPERGALHSSRVEHALIDISAERSLGPETWMKAFKLALDKNPGGTLIADTISHEWNGRDGILQRADKFGDWKRQNVRPAHNEFIEDVMRLPCHVIFVCRAKMQYKVTDEQTGDRNTYRVDALGIGPIQDESLQYEFNLQGSFDRGNHHVVFTGHVDPLIDQDRDLMDDAQLADVSEKLWGWLNEGTPPPPPAEADRKDVLKLTKLLLDEGHTAALIDERFDIAKAENRGVLHPDYVAEKLAAAEARLAEKSAAD